MNGQYVRLNFLVRKEHLRKVGYQGTGTAKAHQRSLAGEVKWFRFVRSVNPPFDSHPSFPLCSTRPSP